eukprot:178083_1
MSNKIKSTITASFDHNTKITKYRWTIRKNQMSQLKVLPDGSHIESDLFQTNENGFLNATWYLRCYPNGYSNQYAGRCQIFLYLSSLSNTYRSIRVYYYISYMNNSASVE